MYFGRRAAKESYKASLGVFTAIRSEDIRKLLSQVQKANPASLKGEHRARSK